MYREYFCAAAHFLAARNVLPEIWLGTPCSEDDLRAVEVRIAGKLPQELREYYEELGDWFRFSPEKELNGLGLAPMSDLMERAEFARFVQEQAEEAIRSGLAELDPGVIRAEAERRTKWFPFDRIGGNYLLCLDLGRDPSPVCYYEAAQWRALAPAHWRFELAPSFSDFIRQWSRYCFSYPANRDYTAFCRDRFGSFDWAPEHFDPSFDRGTTELLPNREG